MKKFVFLAFPFLLLQACSDRHGGISSDSTEQYTPPAPDRIVVQDSMPITKDTLNHFSFSVQVISSPNSASKGAYTVSTAYGFNTAKGEFTMPAGGEHLQPLIKKGTEPYTYIIGFKYGKDNAFYDYFLVSGGDRQIEMKYIKVYSFK